MFGLPETEGCCERVTGPNRPRRTASSARAGCPRPRTCASWARTPGCPAGSAPPVSRPGSSRAADPTSACSCATPQHPVSAARFTATGTPGGAGAGEPRALPPGRAAGGARQLRLRQRGDRSARARRRRQDAGRGGARRGRRPELEVALASTGAISHDLPVDAMLKGILQAREQLGADGDADFQQAIQTTDAFEKRANLEVELPSGSVRLSAQCKGAGMISPRFATMLCFVADRRRARAARRPSCCSACASSARSTAPPSTASSPPTTPRS